MPNLPPITLRFGEIDPFGRPHDGTDFAVPEGTPLGAPFAGTVIAPAAGYGTDVQIASLGLTALVGHMRDVSVRVGDRVDIGTPIGHSGRTGRVTGPHVHLGIKRAGRWIDPMPFVGALFQPGFQGADPPVPDPNPQSPNPEDYTLGGAGSRRYCYYEPGGTPADIVRILSFLACHATNPVTWIRLFEVVGGSALLWYGLKQIGGNVKGVT